MKRQRQTLEEILNSLSQIPSSWQDNHSRAVLNILESCSTDRIDQTIVDNILDRDFDAGLTLIRLILDLSKDEFSFKLRASLSGIGTGIKAYTRDRAGYQSALISMGVSDALEHLTNKPVSWKDIIIERLKSGRESAIKGQARGRFLEDFTERLIKEVFGDAGYDVRCRFVGATGLSTEKADFAVPSKEDPRLVIEVKAYGATGSKQTDILGDIVRVIQQKRPDTHFLLVTDGITWRQRAHDLRKLVDLQNRGEITRIFTLKMEREFSSALQQLRTEHHL